MAGAISRAMNATAFRMSALFIVLFGITAFLLFFYVTSMSARVLLSQMQGSVQEQVNDIRAAYERGGIANLVRFVDRQSRQPGAHLYLIADVSGRIIAGNVRALEPGILDKPGWRGQPFTYERYDNNGRGDFRAVAQVIRLPNQLTLLVGRDVGEPERFREVMRRAITLALGLMAAGGLAAWFFIGRGALKRLDAVSAATNSIIAGDLSRRLPVLGSGGEFDRLSESLNALIARLEVLNSGVRDVSNNVAHDLKTPLTRLRSRADRALSEAATEEELRRALEANIAESDQLIRTFNAILRISRLEAGGQLGNREPVKVDALVRDVVELFEPSAEDINAQITIGDLPKQDIAGNREMLAQVLSNLVENALRYGAEAEGGLTVTVSGRDLPDGKLTIEVADNGPGIAEKDHERVMERFVRLEESRSLPGTGLGLSLVKAMVEAHGGTIALGNNAPGLRVAVTLPAVDKAMAKAKRNSGDTPRTSA